MTIVFKVSDNIKPLMIEFYKDRMEPKNPPYSLFQVKDFDCVTTLYESGKVMFQGIGADIEASYWIEEERIKNGRIIDTTGKEKEKKDDKKVFINVSSIGSDEVGTGDFFGPIVVTATYVSKENISFLTDLGVRDSKKITDDKIKKIAPKIIKNIPYSTFILTNEAYNKNYSANLNMNKIKAILHNKVLVNMKNKGYEYEKIVVDQFVYPTKYYEHIKEAHEKVTNITFMTKAEDKCLSVAAASIISRYIFLKEIDKLSDELHIPIPKGAGTSVNEIGIEIAKKYGFDKLNHIAKMNFKNKDKIKNGI
ncbi:MAG: ribonuclease HIII [Firmicutes bacterium]|nr:ribonuclease HIII [Bacillota bacterium]